MTQNELKASTKQFAHRVLDLCDSLPKTNSGRIVSAELGRCGTSVEANYRAACKARSPAEFIAKIGVFEEEADDSAFWMELVSERKMIRPDKVELLLREAKELPAIMAASRLTASRNAAQVKGSRGKPAVRDAN